VVLEFLAGYVEAANDSFEVIFRCNIAVDHSETRSRGQHATIIPTGFADI
jgi:hypothetical protein